MFMYGLSVPLIVLHIIVVPWVSRVHGTCTLRAKPEGIHITTYKPYILETHGKADLYHDISHCFPDSCRGSLATAKALVS